MNIRTLGQIQKLLDIKNVPKERIDNYLALKGYKERDNHAWRLIDSFPHVLPKDFGNAVRLYNELLEIPWDSSGINIVHRGKKTIKKVFYREGTDTASFEVNLNSGRDVIMYADFLKKEPEIIAAVDFIEEIQERGTTLRVFDGDVFSTIDDWHKDNDVAVYVCDGGPYKRLLYTRGMGYIRNGKPDYDEREYNHYTVTLKNQYKKIGNIYADASFLVESGGDACGNKEEGKSE